MPAARFAVAITVLLVSVGCTADPEPEPIFTEPEPSVIPTATPEKERESLKQFLIRWAEEERDMQNTGETQAYRAITRGCVPCQSLADDMEEVYAAGGYLKTKGMTVRKVEKIKDGAVKVRVDIAPTTYSKSEDGPSGSFGGGAVIYIATAVQGTEGWNLSSLVELAS